MELGFYISALVTLFVIIDPIGLAPVFVALTQGMSARQRRVVGLRAAAISVAVLTLFGIFGEQVLVFAGISMPAFRIAGGILLFLTALEMLFERRSKKREDRAHEELPDPSVFPLATPLMAGPGAIATMVLLTGQVDRAPLDMLLVHLAMIGVIGICLGLFMTASLLERALGHTGIVVVSRLLGMLLAALSIQFILDGLRDFGLAPV
ncbi:MarC family protein [Rhodovulum sp. YEN HP10]|uniref:MarC family protein n=1 Tax=Rhodovulum sp. HP10 TaxID=3387397 RepID=UPI0039DF402E